MQVTTSSPTFGAAAVGCKGSSELVAQLGCLQPMQDSRGQEGAADAGGSGAGVAGRAAGCVVFAERIPGRFRQAERTKAAEALLAKVQVAQTWWVWQRMKLQRGGGLAVASRVAFV